MRLQGRGDLLLWLRGISLLQARVLMRFYHDLDASERLKAQQKATDRIMAELSEDFPVFGDDHGLNERLEAASRTATRMQVPWFTGAYIWDDDVLRAAIQDLANQVARRAIYLDPDEIVLRI